MSLIHDSTSTAPLRHRRSDSPSDDPRGPASAEGPGIFAGLPRSRPQRASARRAAARTAKQSKVPRAHANRSEPAGESVPMQGYESEGDSFNRPIQPPSGTELVASIAELAGELAK